MNAKVQFEARVLGFALRCTGQQRTDGLYFISMCRGGEITDAKFQSNNIKSTSKHSTLIMQKLNADVPKTITKDIKKRINKKQ